jgi:hypothetical protein
MAAYDCFKMFDEVDTLHVKRIHLSGLLLFRYYRLDRSACCIRTLFKHEHLITYRTRHPGMGRVIAIS